MRRRPARRPLTSDPFGLLLDSLAVFRATRLIVEDEITAPIRDPLIEWLEANDHKKLSYLLGCPWCASIWAAAAVLLIRWKAPKVWAQLRWALAMSAVSGIIATNV